MAIHVRCAEIARHCATRATRTLRSASLALILAIPAQAGTWDHGHGDATNSGFADVVTKPALRPSVLVPDIGTYAPGAGPVLGPDGTVYLGNQQGELRALRPDGSLAWMRKLNHGEAILASPVVDTDGSIYVVGSRTYRDHRVSPAVRRSDSTLYRFVPGGGLLWVRPFPERFLGASQQGSRGATSASPNIWRRGSDAAVMIPVTYKAIGGVQLRLLAFSLQGALLNDHLVTHHAYTVTGGAGEFWSDVGCILTFCYLVPGFSISASPGDPADLLPADTTAPMAGLAIFTFAGGGTPWIIVNDPWQATIGHVYAPGQGFLELFRKTNASSYATTPMVLPDGHSVTGTAVSGSYGSRLTFAGPNGQAWPALDLPGFGIYGTPARTADGRIVAVDRSGKVSVVQNAAVAASVLLKSATIAPAAVSRNHLFVSTAGGFHTLDAASLVPLGRVSWVGGGLSSPAIGADGRVYALASNTLFGWPGPARTCAIRSCGALPDKVATIGARS
ncbi:PQQ-like beta-propeller repeat protein [Geminicoccus roseus]|uniref:PQQ-like beta-propeller repeat protein n=1 Tax=Geminicoccus roseus TaxID=404900 RepID=UPI0003F75E79|nr:PQQ-like beta-propeller repeat protein [Geminicoccus roseus]